MPAGCGLHDVLRGLPCDGLSGDNWGECFGRLTFFRGIGRAGPRAGGCQLCLALVGVYWRKRGNRQPELWYFFEPSRLSGLLAAVAD